MLIGVVAQSVKDYFYYLTMRKTLELPADFRNRIAWLYGDPTAPIGAGGRPKAHRDIIRITRNRLDRVMDTRGRIHRGVGSGCVALLSGHVDGHGVAVRDSGEGNDVWEMDPVYPSGCWGG